MTLEHRSGSVNIGEIGRSRQSAIAVGNYTSRPGRMLINVDNCHDNGVAGLNLFGASTPETNLFG